jgi:hypothetical protein
MADEPLSQADLIAMHLQLAAERGLCERPDLCAHIDYALMGLQRLIESHGPTDLYRQWLVQLRPANRSDQSTIIIDL